MSGVEPRRRGLPCGFLDAEYVGLAAVAADGDLVYRRVVFVVVFLGDGFVGRQPAGVQVEEDALRSSQEGVEAARENGHVLGALGGREHLHHGGEGLDSLDIPSQSLDTELIDTLEVGEVEEALAAPYELASGFLSQEHLAQAHQRALCIKPRNDRRRSASCFEHFLDCGFACGFGIVEDLPQAGPCGQRKGSPRLFVQGILWLVLLARHHVEVVALAGERLAEEVLGEHCDLGHIFLGADGGGRGVAMKLRQLARLGFDASLQAAQQVRDLGSERAGVDMGLVDGNVPPVSAEGPSEQRRVLGTQQEVLEHRVVGEQDVRRVLADLLARDDLVGELVLAGVLLFPLRKRLRLSLLGVAGVAAEGDVGALQQHAEPLELVICQGVHRIEDHGSDASGMPLLFELAEDVVEDGQQEALSLARARTGDNRIVAPGGGLSDGPHLMDVERAVRVEVLRLSTSQAQHALAEDLLVNQFRNSLVLAVRRCRLQERALGKVAGFPEDFLQLALQVRVGEVDGCGDVLAIGVLHFARCLDGIEFFDLCHICLPL